MINFDTIIHIIRNHICSIAFIAMLLLTFSLPKTSHAYYAKAFKAGSITAFNHFYTRHNNGINTLYSCNDIEVGFNKNLWAEFELSFMYGHSKINHQQAFGLNYFSVRFFSPIYQGERLNISTGVGIFTPSIYKGRIGAIMSYGETARPTLGINIDYDITKRTRIDLQLYYRRYANYNMLFSGVSYKINIQPIFVWLYADNYINLNNLMDGYMRWTIMIIYPFGKNDRFLIGTSIGYTQMYKDTKFNISQTSVGLILSADFYDIW